MNNFHSIRLTNQEVEDALAVPSQAIVPEMGVDKVFRYTNGKAMPTEITTGIRTEKEVQVLKGLNIGDTIIVSGTLQLRKGSAVKIESFE